MATGKYQPGLIVSGGFAAMLVCAAIVGPLLMVALATGRAGPEVFKPFVPMLTGVVSLAMVSAYVRIFRASEARKAGTLYAMREYMIQCLSIYWAVIVGGCLCLILL